GEDARHAALRELNEETGLVAAAGDLVDLGLHAYRPSKDLALFAWYVSQMPDPANLVCRSTFTAWDGRRRPEFDRFVVAARGEAERLVGESLRAVLLRAWVGPQDKPAPRA
ncbi:MAG TPA: NUDIX domain-containing protein, partial [Acidisphaera sp.]|nr:NUDIX domain-containing protein [Acidisphaera sp.]